MGFSFFKMKGHQTTIVNIDLMTSICHMQQCLACLMWKGAMISLIVLHMSVIPNEFWYSSMTMLQLRSHSCRLHNSISQESLGNIKSCSTEVIRKVELTAKWVKFTGQKFVIPYWAGLEVFIICLRICIFVKTLYFFLCSRSGDGTYLKPPQFP